MCTISLLLSFYRLSSLEQWFAVLELVLLRHPAWAPNLFKWHEIKTKTSQISNGFLSGYAYCILRWQWHDTIRPCVLTPHDANTFIPRRAQVVSKAVQSWPKTLDTSPCVFSKAGILDINSFYCLLLECPMKMPVHVFSFSIGFVLYSL